ncbi:hypothetical protein [Burkholderia contaminans]|uniref:hypothetical protein n=1 Tax=Burkholderia contaminans TaxID=488447 RepID=UPI00158E38B5|nr:hypothetical protein [Burkholderia contaminans]
MRKFVSNFNNIFSRGASLINGLMLTVFLGLINGQPTIAIGWFTILMSMMALDMCGYNQEEVNEKPSMRKLVTNFDIRFFRGERIAFALLTMLILERISSPTEDVFVGVAILLMLLNAFGYNQEGQKQIKKVEAQ